MGAQHTLLPVLDQRVEDTVARKQLARVLLDPEPGAHLQRERQKDRAALVPSAGLQVQKIPEVAMRQVLAALRFDDVAVLRVRAAKDVLQRMHLGQVPHGCPGVGIGKPQPVACAKARMAVDGDAERARQQFIPHQAAQRLRLGLHRVARRATVPGQVGAGALAAHQPGHTVIGVHRRVAVQVHTGGVGAGAAQHAAGVHQRHKHQPHRLKLAVQCAVPAHTGD